MKLQMAKSNVGRILHQLLCLFRGGDRRCHFAGGLIDARGQVSIQRNGFAFLDFEIRGLAAVAERTRLARFGMDCG